MFLWICSTRRQLCCESAPIICFHNTRLELLGEASKKKYWFFMTILRKGGGGVSENPKFPYQKKLRFFWHKGGGSHPIQNGFIRKNEIFWHILPKRGDFIRKNWEFFVIFRQKGGGSRPIRKILIRKIWGIQTKGRGRGGLRILENSHKKPVFFVWCLP